MTRRQHVVLWVSIVVIGVAGVARADVYEAARSPEYGRKAGGMIGRGVINVATSFVDLLVQTVNETKAGPPFVGTLRGMGQGLGCSALRLGSGAVDITTFWVPDFNGFPVARSYEDCLASTQDMEPAVGGAPSTGSPRVREVTPVAPKPVYVK